MGRMWFNIFKDSLDIENNLSQKTNKQFKFGPGNIFTSTEKVKIPVNLGKLKSEIEVYIVECDTPLLISGNQLEKWQVTQDYSNLKIKIGITDEVLPLEKMESGHYMLDLGNKDTDAKYETCFFGLADKKNPDIYSSIKKFTVSRSSIK